MAQYTRTAAGGMIKGGSRAARRLKMKGAPREGARVTPKKKRFKNRRGHNGWAVVSSFNGFNRFGGFGHSF